MEARLVLSVSNTGGSMGSGQMVDGQISRKLGGEPYRLHPCHIVRIKYITYLSTDAML